MRFLHCVAALAALSSVSGVTWDTTSCKIKSTSTSSTACATTDSTLTEIVTGSAASITIPSFDPTTAFPGAILDNVYINFIDAVYNPTVTYQVAGSNTSATLTGFSVSVSVNIGWGLFSSVDSKTLTSAVLQSAVNGLGLGGEASVDTGSDDTTTGCLGGTDTYTPSHILFCQAIGVQGKPFQLTDDQYKTNTLHQTDGLVNFKADYSAPGTYVNYVGPNMAATSGFRVTSSTPAPGYSNAGTWSLTTSASTNFAVPAAVPGSFGVSGASGSQVTVNVAQSLKLQVNVQYDYHVPSVGGDPQFNGFQGQNFQVHGAPDSYFALISAPTYYVNARFDYLSTGRCDYNETQCFTHPGTYMGLIYVGMKDANILIQAGPHDTGFAGILVNDKPIQIGDRFTLSSISANSYIQIVSKSKLILSLDNIIITVHNSDLFVNFDLALTDKQLLTTGSTYHVMPNGASPSQIAHKLSKWYGSFNPLHGLIGQTWRNVKYQDNKLYQGDITEYQLDKIIDHTFLYCVYEA